MDNKEVICLGSCPNCEVNGDDCPKYLEDFICGDNIFECSMSPDCPCDDCQKENVIMDR